MLNTQWSIGTKYVPSKKKKKREICNKSHCKTFSFKDALGVFCKLKSRKTWINYVKKRIQKTLEMTIKPSKNKHHNGHQHSILQCTAMHQFYSNQSTSSNSESSSESLYSTAMRRESIVATSFSIRSCLASCSRCSSTLRS